jgi:CubicO group peptidase (beta-lactamase class C family)
MAPTVRCTLLLLILALPLAAHARQEPETDAAAKGPTPQERLGDLNSLLSGLVDSEGPGIAIRATRGDQVVFEHCYGLANLSDSVPVTTETKFRIGSVTKNFTAAAILKLQEQGKLNVADPVSSVLPDFPGGDRVAIAQLLNHTSGIFSYTNAPEFFDTVRLEIEAKDLIASFQDKPFDFDPGTKFAYNNSGYFLLGHMVAELSGVSYEAFLSEHFFQPLGMQQTGVHNSKQILRHEAEGYSFTGAGYEKALDWDMSHAGGAGALYSTVGDLDLWVRGLFGAEAIEPSSLEAMLTSTILKEDEVDTHYGFGWFIDTHRGLRRYSHGGGLQGFSSHLAYYPDQDLCIAVLHNALPAAPSINTAQFSDKVAVALLEDEMQDIPTFAIDETVTSEMMQKFVGRYDYKTAVMEITVKDDQMFAHLTGQPNHPVYPLSPTKFFYKVVDAQLEFISDQEGTITGIRHTQGINDFVAPKLPDIEPQTLASEILDQHVGNYRFKGLGTMVIVREGDGLTAKLASQPALQIFAKNNNEFFYMIVPAEIIFSDTKDGKSRHITLKQGGVSFEGERIEDE